MNWSEWIQSNLWAVGQVAIAIGGLVTLVSKWSPIIEACMNAWSRTGGTVVRYLQLPFTIEQRTRALESEFKPNGGSTLCDKIAVLGRRLDELSLCVREIQSNVGRFCQIQDAKDSIDHRPLVRFDSGNLLVYANPSAIKLLGVSGPDALGSGWKTLIVLADQRAIGETMAIASAEIRHCVIRFHIAYDGHTTVNVRLSLWPLTDGHRFIGWSGAMEIEDPM